MLAAWTVVLRPESLGGRTDYIVVTGVSMLPTFKAGDFVVVRRQRHYSKGDIVTYRVPKGQAGAGSKVIHRIVGGSPETGYVTKGDNNSYTDLWRPKPADVLGKKWIVLKGFGRYIVRLRDPLPLGILASIVAFLSVMLWKPPEHKRKVGDDDGMAEAATPQPDVPGLAPPALAPAPSTSHVPRSQPRAPAAGPPLLPSPLPRPALPPQPAPTTESTPAEPEPVVAAGGHRDDILPAPGPGPTRRRRRIRRR